MKTVEEIMTKSPACCTRDTALMDIARMMVEYDCGEIPVVDTLNDKRPIGVVTDRDIVCRTVAINIDPRPMPAETVMSVPVQTVSAKTSIDECAKILEENQIRRLPVVDEQGRLCGIVSQADFARLVSPEKAGQIVAEVSVPSETSSQVAA